MIDFFHKLGAGIAGLGMILGSWFGYQPQAPIGATFQTPEVRALFETTLASGISSSATSLTLSSATDIDGTTLASSTYAFIIDEGTATEEFVLADCTGTACTNLQRGISGRTGTTTVASLQKEHRRGASVKITDAPILLFLTNVAKGKQNLENLLTYNSQLTIATTSNQLIHANWANGLANVASTSAQSTILSGVNTFTGSTNTFSNNVSIGGTLGVTGVATLSATSTLSKGATIGSGYGCDGGSSNNQVCDKAYIDGVAVAGASNANDTTKGIVEMATGAEAAASTNLGSTGARLALGANIATSTSQVAQNSVVVSNTLGKIDSTFVATSTVASILNYLSFIHYFGDGTDGNVTISSPTTLTRDMYYNNLTVNSTLTTNGFLVFVKGTLAGSGTITGGTASDGGIGGTGATQSGTATGGAGGAAGARSTTGRLRNTVGVSGATGRASNAGRDAVTGTTGTNATTSATLVDGVSGGAGAPGKSSGGLPGATATGGTGGVSSRFSSPTSTPSFSMFGFDLPLTASPIYYTGHATGGSGGGGGGQDTSGGTNAGGGGGGGSGASGIPVFISANYWTGTFTIQSIGGTGGTGGAAGTPANGGAGGGGGGAGGNGGPTVVFYLVKSWTGSYVLTGGSGGGAGASSGNADAASAGSAGNTGTSIEVNLTNF